MTRLSGSRPPVPSSFPVSRLTQRAEQAGKVFLLIMSVEPAGVGQDPDGRRRKWFRLPPEGRTMPLKRASVGRNSEESDELGPVARELTHQDADAVLELTGTEFIGRRGGAGHEIGYAQAKTQESPFLERRKQPITEPRRMQGRPKPVTRPGKVMSDGGRVQAGVDPTEQHAQVGSEDVPDPAPIRGGELLPSRLLVGSGRTNGR